MATEKGNDRAPVREQTREQLRACQTLIRELFEAHWQLLNKKPASGAGELDQEPVENLPPVQIMKNLIEQQNTLRKLIDDVVEHQRLHDIIEQLRRANAVEDVKISNLGANLRAAESVLQNALDEAKPKLNALKRANKRPVDVDEVISYGSKISASLSAPPGWEPMAPLGTHLPPAPTETMMRSGRLAELTLKDDDSPLDLDRPAPS